MTTPTLQFIVHCWAGQLDQYAHFLRYQLSSLWLYPPETCLISYSLCYDHEDTTTARMWRAFLKDSRRPACVGLHGDSFDRRHLMRRAIGRHLCAKDNCADIVWFGGVDYVFGPGCIDTIVQAASKNPQRIIYPCIVRASKTHDIGDRAVQRSRESTWAPDAGEMPLLDIDRREFGLQRIKRPIGCLQIVSGDVAREHGYVPHAPKYHKPANCWQRTYEDAEHRKYLKQHGIRPLAIRVPHLYRLRHSKQGRFVNDQGEPLK